MLLTTPNGCTFEIAYVWPKSGSKDILWGFRPKKESPFVKFVAEGYEQYMWTTMMWTTSKDIGTLGSKPLNPYLTYAADKEDKAFDWANDDITGENTEPDSTVIANYASTIKTTLVSMIGYKKCIDVAYDLMKMLKTPFEMYQLTLLYEHLLFYVASVHPGIINTFISAMYPVMRFDQCMLNQVANVYCKKQYVIIIPRRHGKTFAIRLVIFAFVVAFPGSNVLSVAQNVKNTGLTSSFIRDYLDIWNREKDPGSISYANIDISKNILISYKGDTRKTVLQFVSATNDNSLRGPDPTVCIVDEHMCINTKRFTTLMALAQKRLCKIGFLSSPTPESKGRLIHFIVVLTSEGSGTNLHMINYFCGSPEHVKYASTQNACVNMMFHKPNHISYNGANKILTSAMTNDNEDYDSELGVIRQSEIDLAKKIYDSKQSNPEEGTHFTEKFYDRLATLDCVTFGMTGDVFIYIDPAFNATPQSGIGIAAMTMVEGRPTVLYLMQKFLTTNELRLCNTIITGIALACLNTVANIIGNPGQCNFFLAIENNNNTAAVAQVYGMIREAANTTVLNPNVVDHLYLYYAEAQYVMPPNLNAIPGTDFVKKHSSETLLPGYCMTYKKHEIVNVVLRELNAGNFYISHGLGKGAKKINGVDMLSYLIRQSKSFVYVPNKKTYTGKRDRHTSDDTMIAVIMSIYMLTTYASRVSDFVGSDKLPWMILQK